jgi:diguanylate cyclase
MTMETLANISLWDVQIPTSLALACVAVVGYLVGRWRCATPQNIVAIESRREVKRAQLVARELEQIAEQVRVNLAKHHASVAKFKERVHSMGDNDKSLQEGWHDICREAEGILGPTMELAQQIARAYDEIRQQGNHLMTLTELRTDPLTGVNNRRALEEMLSGLFAMRSRYELPFSVALIDVDGFRKVNEEEGHARGDRALQSLARLLTDSLRETDFVARYGGEEFVVVMPQTEREGASGNSDRLRKLIQERVKLTVSIGVATAEDGENPQVLLGRADQALQAAKHAGKNQVFQHDGETSLPAAKHDTEFAEAVTVVV